MSSESISRSIQSTMGTSSDEDLDLSDDDDCYDIKHHPSYEQVLLDVNRCAGRLELIRQCYFHRTDDDEPPEDLTEELEKQQSGENDNSDTNDGSVKAECLETSRDLERRARKKKDMQYQRRLKKKLAKLIVRLLIRKPNLHYYQGFHDVCLTYMTFHGEDGALDKLDRLIDSHFLAFMQPTMEETQEFLALIPIIIGLKDKRIQDYLEKAEVGTIFALSWVITWFSHVIPNECDVETIFSHLENFDDPHLILYLCAEIVLHKKEHLLRLEPEMSTVHHFLCQVPRKEKLPLGELLTRSKSSFEEWPPELVKEKLSLHRAKLQMQNYNLIRSITEQLAPAVSGFFSSPGSRRTIIVFVIASALALQFDRWYR